MKVSPKALAPLALVAAFGLGTLAPHAQTPAQKLGFVNTKAVFAADTASKAVNDAVKAIQDKADAELKALDAQVKAIDAKGASATAAERQTRETLISTINSKADAYDKQIADKYTPLEDKINAAVAQVAKANGYSVVMDSVTAAQSSLVIYADPATNLTDAVTKALK